MSKITFNVLTEPWLPVIKPDWDQMEMGLLRCLEKAHELKEIRAPSPIVEFGLYRILTAFVLDMLIFFDRRPFVSLDLKQLLEEGRFDMGMVNKYAESCGDVFDIFHPVHPFLQTMMDKEPPKPLAGMFPAVPSGTNSNLWHHLHEKSYWVSSPEAARLLTTIAPFMTAGGAGLSPSINGAPAFYILPLGKNIFETLVQNIIPPRNQEQGNGKIAWRENRCPGGERLQATLVEALTWRPRQIQLIPETDDEGATIVRNMKFKKGDSTRMEWRDPNLAYRYDKGKVTPFRMRGNRPVWRDAGPLLLMREEVRGSGEEKVVFRRPDVVEQAFEIAGKDNELTINIYGMRTDMKMKIFEWIKSILVVPSNLGISTRLGAIVRNELDRADQVSYYLRINIRNLYPKATDRNKNALSSIICRSERAYWQELEPCFYRLMGCFSSLSKDLEEDTDAINSFANEWRRAIKKFAIKQFEMAAKDMDTDSNALARLVNSRSRLIKKINEIVGEVM